jgi:two-component response regulator ARR-B family
LIIFDHLSLCDMQKYRLYLKRLSAVASQQASIVAAFGGRDPSFLHMEAFEGLQSYQPFGPPAALPSFNPHGLLSRTSAATFGVHELVSSKIVQNATNNGILNHCAGDTNKFQLVGLQENQQTNLAQGSSSSLRLPQLQQKWIHPENNDLSTVFSGSALVNTMSDTLQREANTPLPPQELLELQSKITVQPSLRMPSVSSELVERTVGVSANLRNSNISQESTLPIRDEFSTDPFDSSSAIKLDTTFVPSQSEINATGKFLVGMPVCPSDSLTATNNSKCGASSSGSTMLLPPDTGRLSNYLQFGIGSNSRHEMDGMKQDRLHNQELSSGSFNHNFGACITEQANATVSSLIPQMKVNTVTSEDKVKQKNVYDVGISKLHGGFNSSSCNFDGLLNSIIKAVRT